MKTLETVQLHYSNVRELREALARLTFKEEEHAIYVRNPLGGGVTSLVLVEDTLSDGSIVRDIVIRWQW